MRYRNLLVGVFLCSLISTAASAQPAITFQDGEVRAAGLTPGGDAIYLGAALVRSGYNVRLANGTERITDAESDGAVVYKPGVGLPYESVWVVVDLTTGASQVASPNPKGFALSQEKLNPGQLRQVIRDGEFTLFLLVRPGVGAWASTIIDGGSKDGDRRPDDKVGLDIDSMTPIGSSPAAPKNFDKDDVLFTVDPRTLAVVELRRD
jgi:hypothetical protein